MPGHRASLLRGLVLTSRGRSLRVAGAGGAGPPATSLRGLRVASVGAALLTLSFACKSRNSEPELAPVLGEVVVRDGSRAAAAGRGPRIDPEPLARAARARLAQARVFHDPRGATERDTAARRARADVTATYVLEVVPGPEDASRVRAFMRLSVVLQPDDPSARRFAENTEAAAEAPLRGAAADPTDPALTERLEAFLRRLLDDLLSDYVARLRVGGADEAGILAGLDSDSAVVVEEAARQAGQRRLVAATERLLRLLSHDEEPVRDAALGALLLLGERRAVSELARTRSMRDRREMAKILEVIGALGGGEAMEYLEFVVDAHEDELVKEWAREALARARRRDAAAPP